MRTLYIDDNDINRRMTGIMLDSAGIVMDEAASGADGLKLAAASDYDLLLVDLRMPVMDGYEVMRRVRAGEAGRADVPLIVLTADMAPGVDRRAQEAGADLVLRKPVSRDQLLATLETVKRG